MSGKLKLLVQSLLRPSEVVNAAIKAYIPSVGDQDAEPSLQTKGDGQIGRTRIVAVATHLDPQDGGRSEGCLLILKVPLGLSPAKTDYTFEHAFPITDGFRISMSQAPLHRPDTVHQVDRANSSSDRAALALTIVTNDIPTAEKMILVTSDSEGLRALLEEYRKCKLAASRPDERQKYGWLAAYIGRSNSPAMLLSVPPDLRTLRKPVHTALSPASAGLPGDEAFDMAIIRDDWIRRRVRNHLLSSADRRSSLRVRVGTFNVNGKMPAQDLSAWLRDDQVFERFIPPLKEISPLSLSDLAHSPLNRDTTTDARSSTAADVGRKARVAENQGDPDLFVLAFQELDLSTEALLYSTKTVREDAWCAAVFAGLGEKAVLYQKLVSKQLVGMLLLVIVRKRFKECFSDVRSTSVGAGIMGMMGNKGATAVRITYTPPSADGAAASRSTTLTFVNSHLAAFDEMFDRRNADFHDICRRLLFDSGVSMSEGPMQSDTSAEDTTMTISAFETDVLFWMGDLNYRINLPDADVRYLLSSPPELRRSDMELLLRFDQLFLAQRTRKAFQNFKEFPITHAPSYRFATGTMADVLGYDTKRKPAWTDRILHMNSDMVDIEQISYTSHPDISMSDHKPVSAEFNVRVTGSKEAVFEAFVQDLWRDVGSIEESEEVPKLRIDTTYIDFGSFSCRNSIQRNLHVQNIGKIPCTYRFVSVKPGSDTLAEWFELDHASGLLLPGESTVLKVSTRIDTALSAKLNLSKTELQHTLILHTAMGKDHFITVVAQYERTCFAVSLHMLARLPGPIRALTTSTELLAPDHAVTAPREIMRMINWLMTNATDVEELFLQAGDKQLVDTICECLDTGTEFPFYESEKEPAVALAFGDAFIRFLGLLPEPIIPVSLVTRCTEVTSKDDAFELLEELPAVNLNVWISTTAVLHFIAQQTTSATRIEQLVAVFTLVLLPDEPAAVASPAASIVGKRTFLRYFIL